MPENRHPYHSLTAACAAHQARLVAVSKTRSIEEILAIYAMGQRLFAENRVQEIVAKAPLLPGDIEWHLIGHLQTNKVRMVLPYVSLIHSLDREGLWDAINKEAARAGKIASCLLQIKVAREESKFGWQYEALEHALRQGMHRAYPNVALHGVMGMATLTSDQAQIRAEMRELHGYFQSLKQAYFPDTAAFNILSMGMSGDYAIALEEGSTMIRVGSLLFEAADH